MRKQILLPHHFIGWYMLPPCQVIDVEAIFILVPLRTAESSVVFSSYILSKARRLALDSLNFCTTEISSNNLAPLRDCQLSLLNIFSDISTFCIVRLLLDRPRESNRLSACLGLCFKRFTYAPCVHYTALRTARVYQHNFTSQPKRRTS